MGASLIHFDKTGVGQITAKNWSDAQAGVSQTAEKFFARNNGDRQLNSEQAKIVQVGSNDGNSFLRIGLDVTTVLPPHTLTASVAGTGGVWSVIQTVYYVITALSALGESQACVEISAYIDTITKRVTLGWAITPGATGYKIYRSTTSGTYGASSLRYTINSGSTNQFVDDGSATTSGTPPSANTTAGGAPNYGSPPTLSTNPFSIGNIAIGQWVAYWVNWVIPGGTTETGNPRVTRVVFEELA